MSYDILICGIYNEMVQMNSQNGDSRTSRTNLGLPVHTAVFKMDNEQGTTAQLWELCSVFCDSLDGRGAWGRMETCIYTAESLCCPPETVSTW